MTTHDALVHPSQAMFAEVGNWYGIKDGDAQARGIFDRHYSRKHYADGRKPKLFVGPGTKIVLMNSEGTALFVWRKFISGDGQQGINCAVFRNESTTRSSDLILEAKQVAAHIWPDEMRLFTYVNPKALPKGKRPGYCFECAGWRRCGITKWNKLIILEKVRTSTLMELI